jgi:plastocyanin
MRIKVLGVLVLMLALLGAACSSNDSGGGGSSGGSSSSGGGGGGPQLTIQNFAFDPATLSGSAGQTLEIQITNKDDVEHSFTLDDDSVSKDIEGGGSETVEVTLPDSGTVGWHCKYHPTMTGTITIG